MKRLLKYSKNYILEIIISSLGAFLFAFGFVLVIFFGFNILLDKNFLYENLYLIIFWLIATGLGNAIEHYLGHDIAFKVLRDFRSMVYFKIRKLGPKVLENRDSANLLNLISKDIDSIEVFYAHTIVPIIRTIFYTIFIFYFFSRLNIFVGFSFLLISLLNILISRYIYNKKIYEKSATYHRYNNGLSTDLLEIIKGKDQIIQLNIKNLFFNRVDEKFVRLNDIKEERQFYQDKKTKLISLLNLLFFILFVVVIHFTSGINTSSLAYVFIYPFCFEPYNSISRLPLFLSNGIVAANNMFDFLELEEDKESENSEVKEDIKGKIDFDDIKINNLSFTYPSKDDLVLDNISLNIKAKERVGIFGPSGSGKSTLVKILMKWYEYDQGEILINGFNLRDIPKEEIMSNINYMPQNPSFYSISLRDNLTMFNQNISDDDIYNILKKLNLINRINELKEGLDTILDSNNLSFSSGEKQRLDLVRALLNPSKILILDEPLSNTDKNNGKDVLNILDSLYKGIVIIISHRYEAFDICDSVYEIKNKKIY